MQNSDERLQRLFDLPNRENILYFLETEKSDDLEALYRYADRVRKAYMGDGVHLRAIIEFSNECTCRCRYCGLNVKNKKVTRYSMSPGEIIAAAQEAYDRGYKTVVLQSGENQGYTKEEYVRVIREIKKMPGIAVTLSIGEKSEAEYRAYYEAGADRYLLKHETSDPRFYERLKPGKRLEDRLRCLRNLKDIGYETGSGIMIGLPGQTLESIAGDILLFLELNVDMIGSGPFIPHPGTPLGKAGGRAGAGREDMAYRVLAINRIVTRDTHIPVTTALTTLEGEGARGLGLQRGANVIMPNMTPGRYRGSYDIYPNKSRMETGSIDTRAELESLAAALGRYIV